MKKKTLHQKNKPIHPDPELDAKLQNCEPDILRYIMELQAENMRFQKKIAQLQVKCISTDNRIRLLEDKFQKGNHVTSRDIDRVRTRLFGSAP